MAGLWQCLLKEFGKLRDSWVSFPFRVFEYVQEVFHVADGLNPSRVVVMCCERVDVGRVLLIFANLLVGNDVHDDNPFCMNSSANAAMTIPIAPMTIRFHHTGSVR